MHQGKPIIGIVGGIGSGKSHVARLFNDLGCMIINSDDLVAEAYQLAEVRQAIRNWWGPETIHPDGQINRSFIASHVFQDPRQRKQLEGLLHPIVSRLREARMGRGADDPRVVAFVWDTPLLVETGLHIRCDALVYVDAPLEERIRRVTQNRGWVEGELQRREKSQLPLDKKRELANYIVQNTAGADEEVRSQVREVLSRILAGTPGITQ